MVNRLMVCLTAVLLFGCIKNVEILPGECGVLDDELLAPGDHFILNNKPVHIYDLKELSCKEKLDFLSKDLVTSSAEFTIVYSVPQENLINVHSQFGPDYKDFLIIPEARATTREVFSAIRSDSLLYDDGQRSNSETKIQVKLSRIFEANGINLIQFRLDEVLLSRELKKIKELHLENEYRLLITGEEFQERKKAIDILLKIDSQEIHRILVQVCENDRDGETKKYILDQLKDKYQPENK